MKQPDINSVILALYQASMTPERWPDALRLVSEFVGGRAAAMEFVQLPGSNVQVAANYGYDAQGLLSVMGDQLAEYDPWWPCVQMEPDSDLLIGSKYVPAKHVRNSAFYNEGLRRVEADWRDVMAVLAPLSDESTGIFSVYRGGDQDDFGHVEIVRMQAIRPHIKQAFELASRLGGHELREQISGRISADRGDAVLLLDHKGSVVYANPLAEALLKQVPGPLTTRNGCLRLGCCRADKRLQQALGQCLAGSDPEQTPSSATVLWRSGGTRYSAIVTPHLNRVLPAPLALGRRQPVVVVVVRDFKPDSASIASRVQQAFGLTTAETRILLQFLDGLSPAQICAATGITMNTVKSQCRALYRKTGTANQAGLLRMSLAGFSA
jgi:DNA-binding CsgD family transcriptional regulator/PAS domain-containing protein